MSRGFAPTHAPHRLLLPSTKRVVSSETTHYTTLGDIGCNIKCGRGLLRSFLLSYLQCKSEHVRTRDLIVGPRQPNEEHPGAYVAVRSPTLQAFVLM